MFAGRYFGRRYFAPRYFGKLGAIAPVVAVIRSAVAHISVRSGKAIGIKSTGGSATFTGLDGT